MGLSFSAPQMSKCSPQVFLSLWIYSFRTQAGISPSIISVRGHGESSFSIPQRGTNNNQMETNCSSAKIPRRGIHTFSSCFRNPTPRHNAHWVAASQEKPQKGNIIKKVSLPWGGVAVPSLKPDLAKAVVCCRTGWNRTAKRAHKPAN